MYHLPSMALAAASVASTSEMLPTVKLKLTLTQWDELVEKGDPLVEKIKGPSPGGAASELGVTRQRIHDLIRRGKLDATAVYKGRKLLFYMVSDQSIERQKKARRRYYLERLQDYV